MWIKSIQVKQWRAKISIITIIEKLKKWFILSERVPPRELSVWAGLQGPVCHWRCLRLRQRPPVSQERPVPPGPGNVPADEDGGWRLFLQELFAQNKFHWWVQSAISLAQTQDWDKKSEKKSHFRLGREYCKVWWERRRTREIHDFQLPEEWSKQWIWLSGEFFWWFFFKCDEARELF